MAAERDWLDTQLRSAVIASGDPRLLQAWSERFGFDDLEPWERLAAVLPPGSAQRAVALARVRQLRAEYGLDDGYGRLGQAAGDRLSRDATLR